MPGAMFEDDDRYDPDPDNLFTGDVFDHIFETHEPEEYESNPGAILEPELVDDDGNFNPPPPNFSQDDATDAEWTWADEELYDDN